MEKLKVLMIGNSFSICVGKNLPQMVHLASGISLELTSAYIGGCPLKKHWENLKSTAADSAQKQYRADVWNSETPSEVVSGSASINELLIDNTYDIVTIQQASHESWREESYQPYASDLIAFIKKYNPYAEILIQETWAYRADDSRLQDSENSWGFDQKGMHERLRNAYIKLAKENSFRVIPTGDAVKNARDLSPVKYTPPVAEELDALVYPDLPRQAGDIVGRTSWRIDAETKEFILGTDHIHLNERGEYLQACVWYAMLFNRQTAEIKYEHPQLGKTYCKFLRECAQKAVDEFEQVQGI